MYAVFRQIQKIDDYKFLRLCHVDIYKDHLLPTVRGKFQICGIYLYCIGVYISALYGVMMMIIIIVHVTNKRDDIEQQ